MAFCRWSSMDFGCDLYCYESEQGIVTHVASQRVVGEVPKVESSLFLQLSEETFVQKFLEQQRAQFHFLETAERKPIGLKYDGQTFYDDKESFLIRLNMLREEGYRFPNITQEDIDD